MASLAPSGPETQGGNRDPNSPNRSASRGQELSSVTNMMTFLENSKAKIVSQRQSIPAEADVLSALQACRVVADYITDDSVRPQLSHMVTEMDSAAASLLSLDSPATAASGSAESSKQAQKPAADSISVQVQRMKDKISETAYSIMAHPTVLITPNLLSDYVRVQSRLGKPETLPRVFQLFATKPHPRKVQAGSVELATRSPHDIVNSIEPSVIEAAIDTALEARNLDAAVGIVENSYMTKAFTRNKLVRHSMLPALTLAATPAAAYALATNFSGLQDGLDPSTATKVAFTGILAYVGFTASLGLVALTTANDQMQRVTWAPGVPLRKRWLREDERAALDKIACAWGFQEEWRRGDESGREWETLREYILNKDMILDRPSLMMEDA